MSKQVAESIDRVFISPNVADANGESANVVDAISSLSFSARAVARAITPGSSLSSEDAAGVHVSSLTEATMGITAALCRIAASISELAEAVRDSRQ